MNFRSVKRTLSTLSPSLLLRWFKRMTRERSVTASSGSIASWVSFRYPGRVFGSGGAGVGAGAEGSLELEVSAESLSLSLDTMSVREASISTSWNTPSRRKAGL